MIRYAVFYVSVMAFTMASRSSAQDWQWMRSLAVSHKAESFVGAYGEQGTAPSVIAAGQRNLYYGNADRSISVLSDAEFDRIGLRPRLYTLPQGTVFAAGEQAGVQSGHGLFRLEKGSQGLTTTLINERVFGAATSYDASILGNGVVRLEDAFSFDAGNTWYNIDERPDGIGRGVFRIFRDGDVYVHNAVLSAWYRVDTLLRKYVRAQGYDSSVCHIAELPGGAAMAISCIEGDESQLVVRRSSEAQWEVVEPFNLGNGVVVNPRRHVFLMGEALFSTAAGTALFVLDSGRAVEFDGTNVRLRQFTTEPSIGRLMKAERPRRHDVIRLIYELRLQGKPRRYTLIDVSTISGEVLDYRDRLHSNPLDVDLSGYLSHGPYFTGWHDGITRPAIRLSVVGSTLSTLTEQPYMNQVVVCGTSSVMVGSSGVFVLDSLHLLPRVCQTAVRPLASGILDLTGRESILVADDTTVVYPSLYAPTLISTTSTAETPLPTTGLSQRDVITSAAKDGDGRIVIAGNVILRLNGITWDTIPFPEQLVGPEVTVTISSFVFRGVDTIIVAARGYGVGNSTVGEFQYYRGGVWYTSDGGRSWSERVLPKDEQWVENLSWAPDGSLYCWATSMVQDSAYPQGGRSGSARLYRSDDGGQSWAEIFVDEADEDIRRSTGVHQWSISFSDTNALAICTARGVFVSRGLRGPFQEVLDLPFGAFFGGCAFDSEGMLWVVGTHGVHRRSPLTSAVNEEFYTEASLHVAPMPVTDECTITIRTGGYTNALPDYVTLTSIVGSTSLRVDRQGGTYPTSTQMLSPGLYVVHAKVGRNVVSTLAIITR